MCDSVRLLYLLTLLRVTVARVTGGGTRCVDSSVVWPGGDKGESPGDVWALLSQSAPRTAMSAWGPAEEVDEAKACGAAWGRRARHQGSLSTKAHAEYVLREIRDQAMGSPCYPDEGCFLAMDGRVLCWTIQMPFFGGQDPRSSSRGERAQP